MEIKLLILDVDGILTNGQKTYNQNGEAVYKSFNDRDFTAIKAFKASDVRVVFLSGDKNINKKIASNRNIEFFHSRNPNHTLDKASFISLFHKKMDINPKNMAYIGDDIFDIEIMKKVGMAFCPSDAAPDVKNVSCINVLNVKGGEGVIVAAYYKCINQGWIKKASIKDIIHIDAQENKI